MKTYSELIEQAIEELKNNDNLFCDCIEELDSWNGFADGFRCYDMGDLDEFFRDMKLSDFLDLITSDFNVRDNYFVETIYGLESCDYREDVYRDNVDEGELLDELIDKYNHIDLAWIDAEFDELVQSIIDAKEQATA